MSDWIPFENASYQVEQAFLLSEDMTAVALEQTIVTVSTGRGGKKHLSGTGMVRNILLVEISEENDDLDLVLDFGGEYKYRLATPTISGGKVFSPDTKSSIRFAPVSPWHQIPEPEFETLLGQLKFL
jgi:hypothetical protein